ncbi:MAG: alpha-galactosidase [Lachnospiraceae bacterium]
MKRIEVYENGILMLFEVTEERKIKLLHFSASPFSDADISSWGKTEPFNVVEVQVSGLDRAGERHGTKYVRTSPGYRLVLKEFRDDRNAAGRKIEVETQDEETGLVVTSHYQFYDGIAVVRAWTTLYNGGKEDLGIEYVSSFAITGIEKEGIRLPEDKLELWIPHNGWQRELHWNRYRLDELGMSSTQPEAIRRTSKTIGINNAGNWSTKEYIPMGYLYNEEAGSALYWQIEHNGSWYWEIADQDGHLYLKLSGPTEHQSHWWKNLTPGESFESVPVSVGSLIGGFDEAMGELTKYRRAIRRPNADNENLPVIFNDYMNCLFADPTTEKELPLIEAAKEAGCEYYVIDAGWYADGFWWDYVGEWLPSAKRFPNGLEEVTNRIVEKGMVPGVWLELEVMGIKCPLADQVPEDWYFIRHGKKVSDRSRYQLDFRNPAVQKYASDVIDRLVRDYRVGYIKMDYNIEPGIGTEIGADSFGEGLLGHERAYLEWLEGIFEKYPQLVIENCSSGGLRMDYAMLSRYSIQSTSDTEDYIKYSTIAANAPSALTPEQAAVWSYPLKEGDDEEAIFNMVNAMLLRIHQSGHLAQISRERFALVKEGIDYYKKIRRDLRQGLPFWPLGPASYQDGWASVAIVSGKKTYMAVWRRGSQESTVTLPHKCLRGKKAEAVCAYPADGRGCRFAWNNTLGELTVELSEKISARIFEITEL